MLFSKFTAMDFDACEERKGRPFDENVEIMILDLEAAASLQKLKHILRWAQKYVCAIIVSAFSFYLRCFAS